MTNRRTFLATTLMSGLGATSLPSLAQSGTYPTRAIRMVSPSPPGGGGDVTNRILAKYMADNLGVPVILENKVGGNGTIAAMDVLRSERDGYTIYMGSTTTLVANPYLMKSLQYDPASDFVPVSLLSTFPFILVVNPQLPINSVKDLIAYGKANPGKLSYASANASSQVSASMFARMAGIDMLYVPYKSAPASLSDVVSGQVSISFVDIPSSQGLVSAGKLRVLGVTSEKRFSLAPDIPTIAESGLANYQLIGWTAMCMATGTDPKVVQRLSDAARFAMAKPEVKEAFGKVGFVATSSTPEELGSFMRTERPRWGRMIRDAGIQPE